MAFDLLAVGDLNLDLFLQVKRFPGLDDEVDVQTYLRMPGGDAANVATAAAKLGMNSGILACIGEDEEGDFLLKALHEQKVDTDHVQRTAAQRTGMVTAAVREDGQRNLYTYRGANTRRFFTPRFEEALANTDILHISDPLPGEAAKLADLLKKVMPEVFSLDPGAITAARGLDELAPLLQKSTICFVNEIELRLLTGSDDLEAAITKLSACSPGIVVVKQGANGCLIAASRERIHVPAFAITPVDATGAGDAFDAGFLYSYNKGVPLADAGRFACAVGALSTRSLGAQSAQPSLYEVKVSLSGV